MAAGQESVTRRALLALAVFAVALLVFGGVVAASDVSATGSFRVEASEDVSRDFAGAPRLQSFAWAQWEGKWILIAGRAAAYHGVGQGDVDFPRAKANLSIW